MQITIIVCIYFGPAASKQLTNRSCKCTQLRKIPDSKEKTEETEFYLQSLRLCFSIVFMGAGTKQ